MISKYYDSAAAIQVIGGCMQDPSRMDSDGKYFFSEDDFCTDLHRIIFGAMYSLYNSGVTSHIAKEIEGFLRDKPKDLAIYKANKGREWIKNTYNSIDGSGFDYYYSRFKIMSLLRAYDDCGIDVTNIYDPDNILDADKKQKQDKALDDMSLEQIADIVENKLSFIRDTYIDNYDNESCQLGEGVEQLIEDLKTCPARGYTMYDEYEDIIAMGARLGKVYLRSASSGTGNTWTKIN